MLKLNPNFPLRDKGASNALALDSLPRHRWYFMKEGFSPKLVEEAITVNEIKSGEVLLDPFSGSGTVPLTGALNGLKVHAFEINPFLRFLSKTKLDQADPSAFKKASRVILRGTEHQTPSALEGYSTFTKGKGNRWGRWLFPRQVLRSFEGGRCLISQVGSEYRDLLFLALIGAAMDCCNATRDGKCLRYKNGWADSEATARKFRQRFESRIDIIAEDLSTSPITGTPSFVKEGDARNLIGSAPENKFRLCVTSPPYLNSFDYSDIYRPELFLGGFVNSLESLRNIRLKTIRSHVQASWEDPQKNDFGNLYHDCIAKIQEHTEALWNWRIPKMIQAYFEDMEKILRGLRAKAYENSSAWIVVSTSAYAGVEIPVDLILAEIGQRTGWYLREVGVLRYLRSSSQHFKHVTEENRKSVPLRESVIIFNASKNNALYSF